MQARLTFLNTGPEQTPGVIVMSLSDTVGDNLDPAADRVVVIFNGDNDAITFAAPDWAGRERALHPVLANSADTVVREASWDADAGTFTIPGRTTAVFVQPEGTEPEATPVPTAEPTVAPTATLAPTAAPTEEPTVASTATAEVVTVAPLPTEVAQATPAEEAAGLETTEEEPADNRSAVTAAALLIIAAAAGAAAGVIAWLRSRRVE